MFFGVDRHLGTQGGRLHTSPPDARLTIVKLSRVPAAVNGSAAYGFKGQFGFESRYAIRPVRLSARAAFATSAPTDPGTSDRSLTSRAALPSPNLRPVRPRTAPCGSLA